MRIVVQCFPSWQLARGRERGSRLVSGCPFAAGRDEMELKAIMAKTLAKMSEKGRAAARSLDLPQALRDLAAELPADRIMVETDSPYLAPGKYRGKRNEPAYVGEVAKVLADARGVSPAEIARQTTENFFRLFSKVPAAA